MPYDYTDRGGGSVWLVMLLMMIVFIVLAAIVVWVLVALPRHRSTAAHPQGTRPTAEELLAERLARGEIDADEYRARLTALREHGHAG